MNDISTIDERFRLAAERIYRDNLSAEEMDRLIDRLIAETYPNTFTAARVRLGDVQRDLGRALKYRFLRDVVSVRRWFRRFRLPWGN